MSVSASALDSLLGRCSRILCYLPLLWFVGVASYYVRARIYLGYWPHAYVPDPKSLPFEVQHGFLMLAMYVAFASIFVSPMIWLLRFRRAHSGILGDALCFFVGLGLIVGVIAIPGVDFISWFLD